MLAWELFEDTDRAVVIEVERGQVYSSVFRLDPTNKKGKIYTMTKRKSSKTYPSDLRPLVKIDDISDPIPTFTVTLQLRVPGDSFCTILAMFLPLSDMYMLT